MAEVSFKIAGVTDSNQRIDNYLIKILKGVPRSRIYKAIRSGEVRVNGSRVKASYKLMLDDKVRIPPIRVAEPGEAAVISREWLERIPVLFEDSSLLVVNKPAGLAVHGGTGINFGLIEVFKQLRSELPFLELVHRLDRETSGCLMLAKSRDALRNLHRQLGNDRSISKHYAALVKGSWDDSNNNISIGLARSRHDGLESKTVVDPNGQQSVSKVSVIDRCDIATLVEIELLTGRTHQARVHCAYSGNPIAGDKIYGDKGFNLELAKLGLTRLFLHARSLKLQHPEYKKIVSVEAPVPKNLVNVLDKLELKN